MIERRRSRQRFHGKLPLVALAAGFFVLAAPHALHANTETASARKLFLTGHYAEARQAYERLATREPVAAAIGLARCRSEVGDYEEALRLLAAAATKHPDAAALPAEEARLEFERGDHDAAKHLVDAALARDPDQPAARFLAAELDRVAGRLDQANDGYVWFIRYYNRVQDSLADPEVFRWIGLAAAQYARWNRNASQFHFLVNTLYPDALARDSTYWPIHLEAARLFIEKFNPRDAASELDAAAAINPNAAEVHAARASIAIQQFNLDSARASIERALAINPGLKEAYQLRADLEMAAFGPGGAVAPLERARALDPTDEETLGRLAAAYGALDGIHGEHGSARMEAVIAEAVARNPHCGTFFSSLAASLDLMQKFPYAARYYEEARRRMPQLVAAPGRLGMLAMRLGDEKKAREILTEATEIDPFDARVRNSLNVLEVLQDYGTIETAHFVIRFDRARDSLLARYASRYLEDDVYPEITKKLGFEPPERSLIEIFRSARGTSGHGWFSQRMVGLPFIGTVGACAGKMLAITSPNDGAQKFSWARVLKHEFVHIVNLQQSDFNIPRWFTEGLAVHYEGPGHPGVWDQVLARRVAADSLFDLDDINLGFVRPSSGEDWALAYYQAELYTRYMETAFGAGAPANMIGAYADHLDTRAALKRSFGVTLEAFEAGYRKYLAGIPGGSTPPPPARGYAAEASLESEVEKHPGDAGALARLARAGLEIGPWRARTSAEKALAIDPRQQLAAFVVARVHLLQGEQEQALAVLRGAFDPQHPDPEALALFAQLSLQSRAYAEAESLVAIGLARFPLAADWEAALIPIYRESARPDKLGELLARRAERDPDDLGMRMELARLALEQHRFEAAARWATEAIRIDVTQPEAHAMLARALSETRPSAGSIDEYETAMMLDPGKPERRLALAKACAAAGRKDRAREVLAGLLKRDAHYPGARELLDSLGR
ncbi:MAG TPA: tetratricopeptide repeat protein [Candidatus Eisenbacteria bacterium]|jgi:tetratricopeptide (TPR) repeat protein